MNYPNKFFIFLLIFSTLLTLISCDSEKKEFQGTIFQNEHKAFDVNLKNQYGELINLNDINKIKIVTFLYSNCTDICPSITFKLKEIHKNLENINDKYKIIVISVDPENDTEESILKYSKEYKMEDKWFYLRGDKENLSIIWEKYYISNWIEQNEVKNNISLNHSAPIYIIDENQNMKLLYTEPIKIDEIINDINLLISN